MKMQYTACKHLTQRHNPRVPCLLLKSYMQSTTCCHFCSSSVSVWEEGSQELTHWDSTQRVSLRSTLLSSLVRNQTGCSGLILKKGNQKFITRQLMPLLWHMDSTPIFKLGKLYCIQEMLPCRNSAATETGEKILSDVIWWVKLVWGTVLLKYMIHYYKCY